MERSTRKLRASRNGALTTAQRNALEHVRKRARYTRERDLARIAAVLASAGVHVEADTLIAAIHHSSRVTVNFHPDRLLPDGRSVATALYEEGIYRNQFESKISNGGLTAFAGGDRDIWEEALFGGAYQAAGVTEAERPKYGGLNVMNYSDGACPRFGSCHLRLSAEALHRSTFTSGDSATHPMEIGVIDAFEPVLAALLEDLHSSGNVPGRNGVTVSSFVEDVLIPDAMREPPLSAKEQGRALDEYIEAQIHGTLDLARDIDAMTLDPSFRGTATGERLDALARRYGIAIDWHPGFELAVADVPTDFRGPEMPLLAMRVAENYAGHSQRLNAAAIGQAAASVVAYPERWQDWGTPRNALQHMKYLWHILVVYGKPGWKQEA